MLYQLSYVTFYFAEADGVEPSSRFYPTRQFSRLLHYQLCDASNFSGNGRVRTDYLWDFTPPLYQLSYITI